MKRVYLTFTRKQLKWADVKPAHKKGSRNDKENYRPVSILPNISKIYERCLFKQLTNYFEDHFSKYQCGFRKALVWLTVYYQ